MSELISLSIVDIPAIRRLNINDLMFHSPLPNDISESLDEAVDKMSDLAEQAYEVVSDIQRVADSVTSSLSLPQFKEIEGHLDSLCDVRDAIVDQQATVNDGYNYFRTLIDEQDNGEGDSSKAEDVNSALENAFDEAESLYEAVNENIQSVANYIDQ